MSITPEDIEFAKDLFANIPNVTTRRMMGGLCLYSDDHIFAILSAEGQPYVKAAGALADALAQEGSKKFEMTRKDGSIATMGYWRLPDDAVEDPDQACVWANRALQALEG